MGNHRSVFCSVTGGSQTVPHTLAGSEVCVCVRAYACVCVRVVLTSCSCSVASLHQRQYSCSLGLSGETTWLGSHPAALPVWAELSKVPVLLPSTRPVGVDSGSHASMAGC